MKQVFTTVDKTSVYHQVPTQHHGADVNIMNGVGRGPAAVLLEHLPLVAYPPDAPATYPHSPIYMDPIQDLFRILAGKNIFVNDTNHYVASSAGGGGQQMELFHQEASHMAESRRASTLLLIAARCDRVDVIDLIFDLGQRKQEPSDAADSDSPVLDDESEDEEAATEARFALPGNEEDDGAASTLGRLRRSVRRIQHHHNPWFRLDLGLGRKNRLCKAGVRHWGGSDRRSSATKPDLPTFAARFAKVTTMDKTTSALADDNGQPTSPERAGFVINDSFIDQPSSQERQPLERGMTAAGRGSDLQQKQDASAQYRRYRSPAVDLEVRDGTGKTPLLMAVYYGSLRAAHYLLEHGADLRTLDLDGHSILHLLSERDATFDLLLQEVLRRGVSVMDEDHEGNTPLHLAVCAGQSRNARILIVAGACPDRCNLAGRSPLFLSLHCRGARETILLFLLASRAVCARDRQGRLPLLLQSEENARILERVDVLNKDGDTLLRRCLLVVRRAVGLQRLLDMVQWTLLDLPCPSAVLRALYGEEERAIVGDLCL